MRRRQRSVRRLAVPFLLAVIFLAGTKNSSAQGSKGTIVGHVTDPSGGAVKGANISVEPTAANAVSDVQGQFVINDLQVRGTEPRLTNTTIDGVNLPSEEPGVRQIKFDAIPADIVESVEVSKTLQANMDGDGISSSVNLFTKYIIP
jgi:TonB-dependent Receptor Plug Domain